MISFADPSGRVLSLLTPSVYSVGFKVGLLEPGAWPSMDAAATCAEVLRRFAARSLPSSKVVSVAAGPLTTRLRCSITRFALDGLAYAGPILDLSSFLTNCLLLVAVVPTLARGASDTESSRRAR